MSKAKRERVSLSSIKKVYPLESQCQSSFLLSFLPLWQLARWLRLSPSPPSLRPQAWPRGPPLALSLALRVPRVPVLLRRVARPLSFRMLLFLLEPRLISVTWKMTPQYECFSPSLALQLSCSTEVNRSSSKARPPGGMRNGRVLCFRSQEPASPSRVLLARL